ncbi:MAG: type II toxin-antitoxin system HicB family antitoxin [Planctomycetota bacterium]|nr:type II toxin-antitoxin system HicB family antitoxin [Planctomycetota bacterium]
MKRDRKEDQLGSGPDGEFTDHSDGQCTVILNLEEDGGYSAIALDLAGVGSQGNDLDEALANFKEAFAAAAEEFSAHDESIPWNEGCNSDLVTKDSKILRILVNG